MRFWREPIVAILSLAVAINLARPANACGPFVITPVFVFETSPDLPFSEFTKGTIGIVQPGFGRKTLVIAYRYLNGGSFNQQEQESLIEALRGRAPEDNGRDALKIWIDARKELLAEGEALPEIYVERQHESYDFFPNCAKNAFEVATKTLNDRIASYGREDRNVREWIAAQDTVFQNCSRGATIPVQSGPGSPAWLRKDRDYQIAAAFFYSLNFDEARRRFRTIAGDLESPWQETARYLVARTFVREASLTKDEAKKSELYSNAEVELQNLIGQSSGFQKSARQLLNLVKYQLHPQERAQELARTLANQSGNENVRQDLIDYVWLLDKFEAKVIAEEARRKELLKPPEEREKPGQFQDPEAKDRYEAMQRGDLISIGFAPRMADGTEDYKHYLSLDFKPEAPESEALLAFESNLSRKLTDEEAGNIRERYQSALKNREWLLSPNRKWSHGGMTSYEGGYYDNDHLTLDLVPDFLRNDDLSDWIFTLQTKDAAAYDHALRRWHDTESYAWMAAALIKAEKTSPNLDKLMRAAETVDRHAPAFATIAHEVIRLSMTSGKRDGARKLIDDIISNSFDELPISARNQFLEQRMQLAESMTDFLRYSQRKPVAFYDEGMLGTLADLLRIEKAFWEPGYYDETKEEYDRRIEERYKGALPWDERFAFDDQTADILNWHFPLESLIDAARNPALPHYQQRQLVLAAWTRAILLKRDDLAMQLAPDVMKAAPETTQLLNSYLQARRQSETTPACLSC